VPIILEAGGHAAIWVLGCLGGATLAGPKLLLQKKVLQPCARTCACMHGVQKSASRAARIREAASEGPSEIERARASLAMQPASRLGVSRAQLHASIGVPGEGPLGFNAKATSQEEGFVPYAQEYFDKLDAGVGCSSKVFKHANECASQQTAAISFLLRTQGQQAEQQEG
jgi:hypothetical protein